MRICLILGMGILWGLLAAFNLNQAKPDQNINQVMHQILQQHLQSQTISAPIMRDSIRHYIDQFDPNRVYLLNDEVNHFETFSDAEMKKILEQYKAENYAVFQELDTVIQHSIARARELREEVEEDKALLFQKQNVVSPSKSFPKTVEELKGNIRNDIVAFIEAQKKRFGESFVMKQPVKVIEGYNARAVNHEDQYLYVGKGGAPLSKREQAGLFSIHILKAIARSLDTNTDVLTPSEATNMMIRLEKGYPGVGIVLQLRPKGVYISRVLEQGPAERSGKIKMNDRLVEIDGVGVQNNSVDDVLQKLHGAKGSTVNLTLERKMKEEHRYVDKTFTVSLQREFIPVNEGRVEASYETVGNGIIGKIKLGSFYRGENGVSSVADVRKAIHELDRQGNLRGLILDLRENTGGYLTEAVKVAGLFITNGVVVTAKYADGSKQVFRDIDNHELFNGPLVVLTSKATASAAEIVAQSLQDYGVALVVGDEKTYGKGTIQNQTVTQDEGGASYFKVTIGKFYTVSGKTPEQTGVKADIVVPSQFNYLNFGHEVVDLKNDTIPSAYSDNLEGVPADKRDWYLHYYVPTIQPKTDVWRSLLGTLKKNSSYRISKNKDYQLYLRQMGKGGAEKPEDGDDEEEAAHEKNYGIEDLQMVEAVNIVRDMIMLHHRAEELKMAAREKKSTQ